MLHMTQNTRVEREKLLGRTNKMLRYMFTILYTCFVSCDTQIIYKNEKEIRSKIGVSNC